MRHTGKSQSNTGRYVVVMRRPENKEVPTRCLEGTVHTYKYGNAIQNNKRRSRGHKGITKIS